MNTRPYIIVTYAADDRQTLNPIPYRRNGDVLEFKTEQEAQEVASTIMPPPGGRSWYVIQKLS